MKFKTPCLILFTMLIALFPFTGVQAENNSNEYELHGYSTDRVVNENSSYDYELTGYNIDMVVYENNTMRITERIRADFKIYKHGIIRELPIRNTVIRLDGTTTRNVAKITDISVDETFDTYNENGNRVIKVGSADHTIIGPKDYTISYLYNIGRDPVKDYDELYFNLVGDKWDTTIDNITFRIEMPKEFEQSMLGFSYGPFGSVSSSDVSWSVDGNVISGRYNGRLNPGEALTVRLELPEGYFVNAGQGIDWFSVLTIIISLLFILIVFTMWIRYGKDEPVVETVEFYPPVGFNSAEVGFLYKGRSDGKDITSLLIYLANKGYLRIVEEDEPAPDNSRKGFRLVKIREYDGDNEIERTFFDGLFKNKYEVTYEDLHKKFYKTVNSIETMFGKNKYMHMIFEKTSLKRGLPIVLMIIAVFCLITIKPLSEYSGFSGSVTGLLFPGIGLTVLFAMVFGRFPIGAKIFGALWGTLFGGIPLVFLVLPALLVNPIYLITYMVGIACVFLLIIMMTHMPKRTPFGTEILGKLKGFRTFLETAEKVQLEAMVMEAPSYFYDILPFTYVLGVSDKWIKKFESIALSEPSWYSGRSAFNYNSFRAFSDRTMSSMSSAMTSSPSSGGSGGGSSGGGSGGGGGSSW